MNSFVLLPLVPDIQNFMRRNCTVWDYKRRQMTSNVCGKYCSLFALYTDRGYNPN